MGAHYQCTENWRSNTFTLFGVIVVDNVMPLSPNTNFCQFCHRSLNRFICLLLVEGGKLADKIKPLLEDKKLLAAISRCSDEDTSELESFHSALNRNAPKMHGFSHQGMISRFALCSVCDRFRLEYTPLPITLSFKYFLFIYYF